MANILNTAIVQAFALAAAAGFCAQSVLFAYEKTTEPLQPSNVVEHPRADRSSPKSAFSDFDVAPVAVDMLASRPLFVPSRTPATIEPPPAPVTSEAVAPGPEPEPVLPDYKIAGVFLSRGERRALLRTASQPAQWISQGEVTKEGWTVVAVSAEKAILRRREQEISLSMPGRSVDATNHIASR
jgi:hypothetical protein